MKYNLIFCYILVAAAAVLATDYCNMNCIVNGREKKHIACEAHEEFGPLCPENVEVINITKSLQSVFLHEMNVLRNFVAGGANSTYDYSPACRMATIQWDDELAKHAALNVIGCTEWFDYCHTTDSIRSSGQSVYQAQALLTVTVEEVIEYTLSEWSAITHDMGYGDLLTDRNIRVGCAIASSQYISRIFAANTFWLVCNYAVDTADRDSMYEICAAAGEKCKNKPIAAYPNLCAVGEAYE